jgi:hypothetical protein
MISTAAFGRKINQKSRTGYRGREVSVRTASLSHTRNGVPLDELQETLLGTGGLCLASQTSMGEKAEQPIWSSRRGMMLESKVASQLGWPRRAAISRVRP